MKLRLEACEAVAQRERGLVLDTGRGDIFDRNGLSITGETYKALAVFPLQARSRGFVRPTLLDLAHALQIKPEELEKWMGRSESLHFGRLREDFRRISLVINNWALATLSLNGVRVLPYRNPYPSAFDPKHVIGYISDTPRTAAIEIPT